LLCNVIKHPCQYINRYKQLVTKMSHARLIFEDTPAFVPVPSELQHRKTEVIFLALDDAAKKAIATPVSMGSSIALANEKRLSLPENFFAALQKVDIENPPPLTDLIGKVPACFKSAAEVDAFIRAERDAWDD